MMNNPEEEYQDELTTIREKDSVAKLVLEYYVKWSEDFSMNSVELKSLLLDKDHFFALFCEFLDTYLSVTHDKETVSMDDFKK